MRQAVFVKQNEKKWKSYEDEIKNLSVRGSDKIIKIYVHLTEDLAFARAKYPSSQLCQYLSELTLKVHHHIYKNKPEQKSRLIIFWTNELPEELRRSRYHLLYAFLFILAGVLIGALSASNDASFARLILGDGYVDMTLDNIKHGDPMGVYKSQGEASMFFGITINNIRVSFFAFVAGIFFSIGTAYILFQNGVMLGVFHWLFFSEGLFDETILTIWIHGTLEISAIVIAGAAGFRMGNAILYPQNYPRMYSFQKGAKSGLKIVLSLVPFFIVAGFLESVVTRQTEWPLFVKLLIILISASIVLIYLVILPRFRSYGTKEN